MATVREWVIDGVAREHGKKLALGLLLSLRDTVQQDSQNEALAAAIAFLLGRHYSTIHEMGSPENADRWMAAVLETTMKVAALGGVNVDFGFLRKEE
jgi:hypothetical protein